MFLVGCGDSLSDLVQDLDASIPASQTDVSIDTELDDSVPDNQTDASINIELDASFDTPDTSVLDKSTEAETRSALIDRLPNPTIPANLPQYTNDERPAYAQNTLINSFDNTPADNPITDEGAFLGRVLFYDKLLSYNGEIACASCHAQQYAFTDPEQYSIGFEGGLTGRNSMSLVNQRFYGNGRMFWDERAQTLEDQVLMPIQDQVEMGLTLEELVARVSEAPYYADLFAQAFGSSEVTSIRIAKALAQFVRSLISFDAKWDEGVTQVQNLADNFPNFTDAENRGKRLFLGGPGQPSCAVCHLRNSGPNEQIPNKAIFYMSRARVNGHPSGQDRGLADVTNNTRDEAAFKSPSLRNVALTAPYMHDGVLSTLEDVVDFYDQGINAVSNLDRVLRDLNGQPIQFGFSSQDKEDLVAFLNTLTGSDLMTNAKFASPFDTPTE